MKIILVILALLMIGCSPLQYPYVTRYDFGKRQKVVRIKETKDTKIKRVKKFGIKIELPIFVLGTIGGFYMIRE